MNPTPNGRTDCELCDLPCSHALGDVLVVYDKSQPLGEQVKRAHASHFNPDLHSPEELALNLRLLFADWLLPIYSPNARKVHLAKAH